VTADLRHLQGNELELRAKYAELVMKVCAGEMASSSAADLVNSVLVEDFKDSKGRIARRLPGFTQVIEGHRPLSNDHSTSRMASQNLGQCSASYWLRFECESEAFIYSRWATCRCELAKRSSNRLSPCMENASSRSWTTLACQKALLSVPT
jgi:hypothetical protein